MPRRTRSFAVSAGFSLAVALPRLARLRPRRSALPGRAEAAGGLVGLLQGSAAPLQPGSERGRVHEGSPDQRGFLARPASGSEAQRGRGQPCPLRGGGSLRIGFRQGGRLARQLHGRQPGARELLVRGHEPGAVQRGRDRRGDLLEVRDEPGRLLRRGPVRRGPVEGGARPGRLQRGQAVGRQSSASPTSRGRSSAGSTCPAPT